MTLLKEHRIYRHRISDAVLYVCFERLDSGEFSVQQMEYFSFKDRKSIVHTSSEIAANVLELFADDSPLDRCSWHQTLEEAIKAHDLSFENQVG